MHTVHEGPSCGKMGKPKLPAQCFLLFLMPGFLSGFLLLLDRNMGRKFDGV